MTRVALPKAALLVLLVAFLAAPEAFAGLFRPFAPAGTPAIYAQTPLLTLTVNHLLLVATATLVASLLAVGSAVAATRPVVTAR